AVSTEIALPSGFVPDVTAMDTNAVDTTTAVQFTVTDVGSDFTESDLTHVIRHKGQTKVAKTTVQMINKRPTRAKVDYAGVLPDSGATVIDVLHNDWVSADKTL